MYNSKGRRSCIIHRKVQTPQEKQERNLGCDATSRGKMIRKIIYHVYNRLKTYRWEVLARLINKNNLTSYAEIGVWKGETTKYILEHCKGLEKVYCVDSYTNNNDLFDEDKIAEARTSVYPLFKHPKVTFIEEPSAEASKEIKDKSLDLIFIDADHSYKDCKQDILCWYPKLKEGGILCGHDYAIEYMGVINSVSEFSEQSTIFERVRMMQDKVWVMKLKGSKAKI